MQARGILPDVSHTSDRSFWDILKLAEGPVVASHSNCRALCDVRRNLTDEQLRAIRDTGGVIGVNVYHGFVHAEPRMQTAAMLGPPTPPISRRPSGRSTWPAALIFVNTSARECRAARAWRAAPRPEISSSSWSGWAFQWQSCRALPLKICCGCWNRWKIQCENRNFFCGFRTFFCPYGEMRPCFCEKGLKLFINMAYNILCIDIERDGSAAP